ncbi:hypothetical protein BDV06DRAFT_208379 [Aspergillus oleicola]
MDSTLPPYFIYHEAFKLITCRIHLMAIHPTKIHDHMAKDHQDTPRTLENLLIQPLEESHRLIQARQPIQPLEGLQDPKPGFKCSICGMVKVSQL